ncbi:MAG: signal recognition particle protein [Candidatus Brocadiae bacterium]|nr:signal recognition particle protein [Candidatus Brocadiia bacterium]
MFESLTEKLNDVVRNLSGRGRLSEKNVQDALREVRTALLEADVHYRVVKEFIQRVGEKAVGEEVVRGVNPAQQIVKIVHDEIEALIGPVDTTIPMRQDGPTVLMVCGLQGSGKTTTCAKLALYLQQNYSCSPLLAATDVRRPAAIEQLEILGREVGVPVVSDRSADATMVAMKARFEASEKGLGPVILDTAGRLHIDEEMMEELRQLKARTRPDQIYLVADAMTGQDAVNSALEFNRSLEFDGVILTKLDGDARGGAALSVKAVTGKPIKFVGLGEKLDKFEPFYPERMADRILGMGDVVGLVEMAQQAIEEEDAQRLEEKLRRATFDLEDFRQQIGTLRKMGPIRDILGHLPFIGSKLEQLEGVDDRQVDHIEAMINSMTAAERKSPELINASRRQRIARGSGSDPVMVNQLLKQFKQMKKVMRKLSRGNMDALLDIAPAGLDQMPGAMPRGGSQRKRKSKKSRRRRR